MDGWDVKTYKKKTTKTAATAHAQAPSLFLHRNLRSLFSPVGSLTLSKSLTCGIEGRRRRTAIRQRLQKVWGWGKESSQAECAPCAKG
jgi:hypothetical protein